MVKFRFQDLKIWQLAIEIADELFDIADELEKKKLLINHINQALCAMPYALCALPCAAKPIIVR